MLFSDCAFSSSPQLWYTFQQSQLFCFFCVGSLLIILCAVRCPVTRVNTRNCLIFSPHVFSSLQGKRKSGSIDLVKEVGTAGKLCKACVGCWVWVTYLVSVMSRYEPYLTNETSWIFSLSLRISVFIHFISVLQLFLVLFPFCRFSVTKYGNNYSGGFHFLVDNKKVAYIYEYDPDNSYPTGVATINLYLTADQTVQVENIGSTTVYGGRRYPSSLGYRSWSTVFLLFPI